MASPSRELALSVTLVHTGADMLYPLQPAFMHNFPAPVNAVFWASTSA
jgi:hypothetical protein